MRCDQKPMGQKRQIWQNKLLTSMKTNKILRCNKLSNFFYWQQKLSLHSLAQQTQLYESPTLRHRAVSENSGAGVSEEIKRAKNHGSTEKPSKFLTIHQEKNANKFIISLVLSLTVSLQTYAFYIFDEM